MTTPSAMPGAAGPYPQTPPGPYSQTPYGQPPQPPKKRRTWLIVLLVILAVMLIGLVSCGALIGSAGKAITEASTEASQSQQAQDDKNAPREVTPGKAFTVGKHKTLEGWKVEQDTSLGDAMFSVTGKVKNISNDTSTAFIHFKFIDKSGEVLGNVDCNSSDLEPGQTQALNCIPDGKYRKYTTVTAEATF
jgi:Sec-independent protein translocase protein TatA